MNIFKLLEKSTTLSNAADELCGYYKKLLKEREEAIVEAYRIVESFNSSVLNVANVQFAAPIKIQWIGEDEIWDDEVTEVYNCGMLEYGLMGEDCDIPIACLTLDSLRLVRKEMERGQWDVCLLDSDEDFHLVSYEEFWEISKSEHEKRYDYHTQDR